MEKNENTILHALCDDDLELAYRQLEYTAKFGHPMACYYLAHLVYDNFDKIYFIDKVDDAIHFAKCFLEYYVEVDDRMFKSIQILLNQLETI